MTPWVALRRVGNPCRDMPGHRNRQEDQQAGERMPAPQMAQVPVEQQKDEDNAQREDDSDESLGEHIEGASRGETPGRRA